MDRRRKISKLYRERTLRGGVYTISNTVNGRYLIGHTADLTSVRNRFQFAVTTGATVDPRLREDWQTMGAGAFTLDVLEELEQRPGETEAEFMDDLRALETLLRASLAAEKEY